MYYNLIYDSKRSEACIDFSNDVFFNVSDDIFIKTVIYFFVIFSRFRIVFGM